MAKKESTRRRIRAAKKVNRTNVRNLMHMRGRNGTGV